MQAHARVEEHGDGRPRALRKAAAEKAVDGCAGLPQARGIGDPDHPAVPEKCGPGADHRSSSRTRFASEGFSVAFQHASSMLYLDPAGTPVILSFCHPVIVLGVPKNKPKVAPKRPMTGNDRRAPLCHAARVQKIE